MKKKIIQAASAFALSAVFLVVLGHSRMITWLENKIYDNRMEVTAPFCRASDRIGVILLDQDSLNWAQKEMGWGWPWPREAYGVMLDYFTRASASSVAFDMIYSEPSIYGKQDDEVFAQALKRNGRAILAMHTKEMENKNQDTGPVQELASACAYIADITGTADSDGVYRRGACNNFDKSTLSYAGFLVSGELPSELVFSDKGGINIRYLEGLERFVPYKAMIILQSEYEIRKAEKQGLTLDESFFEEKGLLSPEQFKDNFVFFGLYAPGLFDICATPISASSQGVGVHISLLNTILEESWLFEFSSAVSIFLVVCGILLGFIFGSSFVLKKFNSIMVKSVFAGFILILYIVASYAAFYKGYILPVAMPVAGLLISFIIFVFEDYVIEGRQKKYLKTAFSQYLSPAVINDLIQNPDLLQLGGEEREITAYFSDIQGFTTISESLTPAELTVVLNKYLSAMTDIILAHGGTIDKYEGDAIIAFWGAPVVQKDHARRAVEAALECQRKLEEMNPELQALSGGKVFKQRIGLNTGFAVVGNMGSVQRFDYTMMGDTVNLASRLEGINKQFGTYTMCSKATMESALNSQCDKAFRKIGNIAVVGKKTGVQVFVPMEKSQMESETLLLQEFEKGLNLFEKGDFEEARKVFEANSQDAPSKKYVDKCTALINNPPENWDGVIRATEK